MIVVMRKGSSQKHVDEVNCRIEFHGLKSQISHGSDTTVIGVLGTVPRDLKDEVAALPGVNEVVPITKPYKLASREFHPDNSVVKVGNVSIGGPEPVIMAGPCTVEDEDQVIGTARAVKAAGASILRGGAYKPRTSPYSFRGMGVDGLKLLNLAKQETGLQVITEVMAPGDVDTVAKYADILQIGARNMQNYNLLDAVGQTDKPVMVKRGIAAPYEEWLLAAEYIMAGGNCNVMMCERGIRSFEPYTRFTMDVAAIPVIKHLSHLPIIADPSHSTGHRHLVTPVALAAVAAGAHGLLVEVHPNPETAKCDGPQSLTFDNFNSLMDQVRSLVGAILKEPVAVS